MVGNNIIINGEGPGVQTTRDEIENKGFTLKMPHMFSVQTTPKENENVTKTAHFGFMVDEIKLGQSDHVVIVMSFFRKDLFLKYFRRSTLKHKAVSFKLLRFEKRFQKKLCLRDGLVWTQEAAWSSGLGRWI